MPRTKSTEKKNSENHAVKQVIDIIKFMGENSLAEIDLETAEIKMSLKKHSQVQMIATQNVAAPVMHYQAPLSAEAPQTKNGVESEKKADPEVNYKQILSPMSGTFYRAPSPTSPAFVNSGDNVTTGQTVCIVEAMKMMNEIKSDFDGKIVKILIENGEPVEKGAALFYVE